MKKIADVAFSRAYFGKCADYKRVRDELDKFSDYDLNELCMEYPDSLGHLQLPPEALYDSQKMRKLRKMLPALASDGHRMLVFSQVKETAGRQDATSQSLDRPCTYPHDLATAQPSFIF